MFRKEKSAVEDYSEKSGSTVKAEGREGVELGEVRLKVGVMDII